MRNEELAQALRPLITEYPERRVSVPAYPPARRKRGVSLPEQTALGDEAPGALPAGGLNASMSVVLWSLQISSNTAGVSIRRGSPSFVGPGLVHSFTGFIRSHTTGGVVYPPQLAYADVPYQDTDSGASLTKLSGTHIGLTSDPYSNTPQTVAMGEGFVTENTTPLGFYPIGVYIPLERFYLGVQCQGSAAGQAGWVGIFRIIQNAPPESISWL